MQGIHTLVSGHIDPRGLMPSSEWSEAARILRESGLTREMGSLVGHVAIEADSTTEYEIRTIGGNFANAAQPPLSADELSEFNAGIDGVVAVNNALGEML